MTIEIDSHLPPPPPTNGRPRRYPFNAMAVGDSFAVPLTGDMRDGEDIAAIRLRASAIRHAKRFGGKFTVRTDRTANEARCWRTE